MPRACRTCGRVVAEAAYCPFCAEPTIEHVPVHRNRSDARTIRTLLERRRTVTAGMCVFSFLIAFGGMFLAILLNARPAPFIVVFISFALFPIAILYGTPFPFRCSRCGNNIELNAIDQNNRYCPHCGVDLAVENAPESHEPAVCLKKEWGQREIKNTDIQLSSGIRKGDTDLQLPPGKRAKGTA